jgi:hypothetical protein
VLVAATLSSAVLAGCGSSKRPAAPNGEASKSAQQIVADAEAALGRVHSFHIDGAAKDVHGARVKFTADVVLPGRLRLAVIQSTGTIEFIFVDGNSYLRASRDFWARHGARPDVIAVVADRWVKLPASATSAAGLPSAWTSPATVGHCVIGTDLGSLSLAGKGTVGAQPAVIVADQGDKPGGSPGRLYVATRGPPLPLREVSTGPEKPGGRPDPRCNETETSSASITSGEFEFSRYNAPVKISAPTPVVELSRPGTANPS